MLFIGALSHVGDVRVISAMPSLNAKYTGNALLEVSVGSLGTADDRGVADNHHL